MNIKVLKRKQDIYIYAYYETVEGSGAMLSQMYTFDCAKCGYAHQDGAELLSDTVKQIALHKATH